MKQILEMIENVKPDDIVQLDEIDARVWAYITLEGDFKIHFVEGSGTIHYRHNDWKDESHTILHHTFMHDEYTRSRDALKAIRPEGWDFVCGPSFCHGYKDDALEIEVYADNDSECLNELHAIIQAAQRERSK